MSSLNEALGVNSVDRSDYKLLTKDLIDFNHKYINKPELASMTIRLTSKNDNAVSYVDADYDPLETIESPKVIIIKHNQLVDQDFKEKINAGDLIDQYMKVAQSNDNVLFDISNESTTRKLVLEFTANENKQQDNEQDEQQEQTQEDQNNQKEKDDL